MRETGGQPKDIYGGRDPAEIPAYTIAEAAQWLRVPYSTTRAWLLGQAGFQPVVAIAERAPGLLSFRNLVELHVLAAIRRGHNVPLQRVRVAVEFLQSKLGVPNPLASQQLLTDGRDLLVEAYDRFLAVKRPQRVQASLFTDKARGVQGHLVNVSRRGQLELHELVKVYLDRIVVSDLGPVRFYPFSMKWEYEDPRLIEIDPRVQFGRPCLAGTGVPTAEIADRCKAGESIDCLATDFELPRDQIEAAIRYELPLAA